LRAKIKFSGIPHNPKPPAMIDMPSKSNPSSAAAAVEKTLFMSASQNWRTIIGDAAHVGNPASACAKDVPQAARLACALNE
jgi:hypothetical protein